MEANKNPFSLSLQAQEEEAEERRASSRAVMEDPDLDRMIEQEPDYEDASENMKIIEEKAKLWTQTQRITTPRDCSAPTSFPAAVVADSQPT
jgi:hypothetical protein